MVGCFCRRVYPVSRDAQDDAQPGVHPDEGGDEYEKISEFFQVGRRSYLEILNDDRKRGDGEELENNIIPFVRMGEIPNGSSQAEQYNERKERPIPVEGAEYH